MCFGIKCGGEVCDKLELSVLYTILEIAGDKLNCKYG